MLPDRVIIYQQQQDSNATGLVFERPINLLQVFLERSLATSVNQKIIKNAVATNAAAKEESINSLVALLDAPVVSTKIAY